MNRVIVILAAGLLLQVAGCEGRRPGETAPDAPAPMAAAEKGNGEVKPDSEDARPEDEIALRSARWKNERRVQDFLWLVVHATPAGSSQADVEALLGKPLRETRPVGNESEWRYVKSAPEQQQVDTLSLVFDAEGRLQEFLAVPEKSEELRLGLGVPRQPPRTPTEVREAFVAQVRPIVKRRAKRPEREYLRPLISQSLLVVRRQSCARALRMLEGIVPESERAEMILHGSFDGLRRDGECWTVEDFGMGFGMIGHLDESTGELILVANPPRQ